MGVVGGGLGTALILEWLRRRRERPAELYLFERRAEKLPGSPSDQADRPTLYEVALVNGRRRHLKDVVIQFEFASESIAPTTTRPSKSQSPLVPEEPVGLVEPWTKGLRWRVPQLEKGDRVEFVFWDSAGALPNYKVSLDADDAVVLKRVNVRPEAEQAYRLAIKAPVVGMAVLSVLLVGFYSYSEFVVRPEIRDIRADFETSLAEFQGGYEFRNAVALADGNSKVQIVSECIRLSEGWEYRYLVLNVGDSEVQFQWDAIGPPPSMAWEGRVPVGQSSVRTVNTDASPVEKELHVAISGAKTKLTCAVPAQSGN